MHSIAENKDENLCCIYDKYSYKDYIKDQIAIISSSGMNLDPYKVHSVSFVEGKEIIQTNSIDLKHRLKFSSMAFRTQMKNLLSIIEFYEKSYPSVKNILDHKTKS